VFKEIDHFIIANPIKVYKTHMNYEVVRSFLDFSYEESNFSSAMSLFTYAKAWRIGVYLYTRYPVDQTVKIDIKNIRLSPLSLEPAFPSYLLSWYR
jgi:hypothetical protein